jgi:hypothetical protein
MASPPPEQANCSIAINSGAVDRKKLVSPVTKVGRAPATGCLLNPLAESAHFLLPVSTTEGSPLFREPFAVGFVVDVPEAEGLVGGVGTEIWEWERGGVSIGEDDVGPVAMAPRGAPGTSIEVSG